MRRSARLNEWAKRVANHAHIHYINAPAHLAGARPATVRRWMYGYVIEAVRMHPVFKLLTNAIFESLARATFELLARVNKQSAQNSLLQLAELVIVGRFQSSGIGFGRLLRAHQFADERYEPDYPFARSSLVGGGIRSLRSSEEIEPGTSLLVLDQSGKLNFPKYVVEMLDTFEFRKIQQHDVFLWETRPP